MSRRAFGLLIIIGKNDCMVLLRTKVVIEDNVVTNIKIELFFYFLFSVTCAIVCYALFATWVRYDFCFDFNSNIWPLWMFAFLILTVLFMFFGVLNVDKLFWVRKGVEKVSLINDVLYVVWEGKIFSYKKLVQTKNIISISFCKPWQRPLGMASPLYTFRQVGYKNGKIEIKYRINKNIHTIKIGLFLSDKDAHNTILVLDRMMNRQKSLFGSGLHRS